MKSLWSHAVLVGVLALGVASAARATLVQQLNLDADSHVLADGTTVTSWTDTSGFGRNATASSTPTGPKFYNNVINGQPVMRFTGGPGVGNTQLGVDFTLAIAQPLTFFVVAKVAGNNGANSTDYLFDDQTGASRVAAAFTGGLNNKLLAYAGGAFYPEGGAFATDFQNQWLIYEVYFNGASTAIYTNGSLLASGTTGANGITAAADLLIGSRFNDSGSGLNGDIAEFRLYSGLPTPAERIAVGYALAQEYNLVGAYGFIPEPSTFLLLLAGGGLLWGQGATAVSRRSDVSRQRSGVRTRFH